MMKRLICCVLHKGAGGIFIVFNLSTNGQWFVGVNSICFYISCWW